MPKTLINQNTADAYTDSAGANINSVYQSRGGWCTHSAQVYAQIQHSPEGAQQGQEQWSEEFVLPAGAHYLQPGLIGIRFRSFTTGVPVAVSAALFFKDEPAMQLGGSGISSPSTSVASLNFQKNDVGVATEPTADFMDATNVLSWAVVDDAANTRVRITPSFSSTLIFPGSATSVGDIVAGNAVNGVANTPIGSGLHNTGTVFSSTSSATGGAFTTTTNGLADTQLRFKIDSSGTHSWGSGAALFDCVAGRTSATGFSWTTSTNVYTGASFVAGMGGDGASPLFNTFGPAAGAALNGGGVLMVSRAAGNAAITVTNPGTTTDWRWSVTTDGVIAWAAVNTASDTKLSRQGVSLLVVQTPTGAASRGFGYQSGVGNGAAATQATNFNTGVTCTGVCGTITLFTSATVAGTVSEFTVTNNAVAANDVIILSWGTGTNTGAILSVSNVAAGSFKITWDAVQSNASSTRTINFAVIKAASN